MGGLKLSKLITWVRFSVYAMNIATQRLLHFYNLRNTFPKEYHPILVKHILKIKQYNNLRKVEIMKYINKKTLTFNNNEPITKD